MKLRQLVARRVRSLRRARGLSQEALAHRAGLSVSLVARVERLALDVRLSTVEALARGLGVGAAELVRRR